MALGTCVDFRVVAVPGTFFRHSETTLQSQCRRVRLIVDLIGVWKLKPSPANEALLKTDNDRPSGDVDWLSLVEVPVICTVVLACASIATLNVAQNRDSRFAPVSLDS